MPWACWRARGDRSRANRRAGSHTRAAATRWRYSSWSAQRRARSTGWCRSPRIVAHVRGPRRRASRGDAGSALPAVDDMGWVDAIGRATPLAAFGPAEDAGLVQIAEGRLEFRHPLVRSAIYQRASPTERRAAHAALPQRSHKSRYLASCVASRSLPPGARRDVAAALGRGSPLRHRRHGAAAAAAAWRRAAELTPDGQTRARRFLAASEAFWEAGAGDTANQAAASRRGAACSDPLPARRHRSRPRADRLALRRGCRGGLGGVAGRGGCRRSFRLVASGVPAGRRSVRPYPLHGGASRTSTSRALPTAAAGSDDPLFDYVVGFELARDGSFDEAMQILGAVERRILDPRLRDDPFKLMLAADCVYMRGDVHRTCVLSTEAVDRARELGRAGVVAEVVVTLAGYEIDDGGWDDAEAALVEAIRLGEDTGQLTVVGEALSRRAEIAARRGDAARFEEWSDRAAHATSRRRHRSAHSSATHAVCWRSRRGVPTSRSRPANRPSATRSNNCPQTRSVDLIEAYVRAGRSDEARASLDRNRDTHPPLWATRRVRALPRASRRCRPLRRPARGVDSAFHPFRRRVRVCPHPALLRRTPPPRQPPPRRPPGELGAALDTFEHLRAAPMNDRARP